MEYCAYFDKEKKVILSCHVLLTRCTWEGLNGSYTCDFDVVWVHLLGSESQKANGAS